MPHPTSPAPLTRRLLAALESHAREDAGPLALADWPALSSLFDRELALLTRLAAAAQAEGAAEDAEVQSRAAALQRRYRDRAGTMARHARELQAERDAIRSSRRNARAVGAAYAAR